MEEESLAGPAVLAAPLSQSSAVRGRVAQLMGGLDLHAPAEDGAMSDDDL